MGKEGRQAEMGEGRRGGWGRKAGGEGRAAVGAGHRPPAFSGDATVAHTKAQFLQQPGSDRPQPASRASQTKTSTERERMALCLTKTQ